MRNANRNGFIEYCRFLLALCVVSHHALFYNNHGHIPVIGGYIAVEFFYILTGFFLAASAQKEGEYYNSAINQVVAKLRKVYPYFLGSWLISFVISHVYNNNLGILSIVADLIKGIPQLLLLSMAGLSGGRIGLSDYVGTGWYLGALVIAIITVYPILRMFCKPASRNKEEIFTGGIAPFMVLLCYGYIGYNYNSLGVVNERISFTYLGCVRAVGGICLGIFCKYIVQKLKQVHLTKAGNYVISASQLLLLALSLLLMEHYTGFFDIIQVILFAALIIISFAFDTELNKKCSCSFANKLGQFSMIIFISQSLAYMYPIFPYPSTWKYHYLAHFGYVFLVSFVNFGVVLLGKWLLKKLNLKKLLFKGKDE